MEQEDTEFYKTLGIDVAKQDVLSLSDKDIASAYRKAALRWHPDKNQGDPKASERFSRVFLAYETLSNPAKRKQYDDRIRQVRTRRRAHQQMDVTRRKMREQLHEREIQAARQQKQDGHQQQQQYHHDDSAISRVQREIERLRRDAILKEQRERERQQRHSAAKQAHKQDVPSTDGDFGVWADVPGFKQFRAPQPSVPFDEFEDAILNGRNPF